MSLTLNMVGGAGGAGLKDTDAVLVVTVPTGSTVTATKGGVTLTPTMWVTAADPTLDCAIFAISASLFDAVNPWTVTATKGIDTRSVTVTVDSNKAYEVEITYPLYLYRNGDLCTSVTGGYSRSGSAGTFTNDTVNGWMMFLSGNAGTLRYAASNDAFSVVGFTKLIVSCRLILSPGTASNYRVGLGTAKNSFAVSANVPNNTETFGEVEIDLTSLDQSKDYYFVFSNYSGNEDTGQTTIRYAYLDI